MTAVLEPALDMPAPFAGLPVGAHTEYGRRYLSWTLPGPGELYRNRYEHAWIQVTEQQPWRGEPLWLSASRRIDASTMRSSFTDAARQRLHADVVPVIARHGFDRLWVAAHGAEIRPDRSAMEAAGARRVVAWWEAKTALEELHEARAVEFRPVRREPGQRTPTQLVVTPYAAGQGHEEVVAEALVDGEHAGWMTRRGYLVPDGRILQETPT